MFLEFPEGGPPSDPWQPERPTPRLSPRGERILFAVIALNLALLLAAPIAGVTFYDALKAFLAP